MDQGPNDLRTSPPPRRQSQRQGTSEASRAEHGNGAEAVLAGRHPKKQAHRLAFYFSPTQYREPGKALVNNGDVRTGRGFADKETALMKLVRTAAQLNGKRTTFVQPPVRKRQRSAPA